MITWREKMTHNYTDVIAIDESLIEELSDIDAGDSSWWVSTQIENALEALIEKINENKYIERKVVILKKKERSEDCNYPKGEICPICEWEEPEPTKYWGDN